MPASSLPTSNRPPPRAVVVEFPRKEREVLELLRGGVAHKLIAAMLELSATTIRDRIKQSCARAQVIDESELLLFLLQHPGILVKGAVCAPGLHIPVMREVPAEFEAEEVEPCTCGDVDCVGWFEMILKKA